MVNNLWKFILYQTTRQIQILNKGKTSVPANGNRETNSQLMYKKDRAEEEVQSNTTIAFLEAFKVEQNSTIHYTENELV